MSTDTKPATTGAGWQFEQFFLHTRSGAAIHEILLDESGRPVDYRFLAVNQAFETITGLSSAAVIGRRVREIFQGESTTDLIARYGRVALTGEAEQFEIYFPDLDKYFDISAFQTAPGQFGVMFTDISRRKMEERRQAAQEARFRGMFEQAGQPMAIVSLEGEILVANPFFSNLIGYSAARVAGMTIAELTAEEDYAQEKDHLEALRSGLAESFILQKRYRRRDGQLVWGLQSVARVSTDDHDVDYFIYQVQDIGEQKNLETRLRYRSEFQALISDISTTFLKLQAEEFPPAIQEALARIVNFTGAAQGHISRFSDDKKTYWLEYVWERVPRGLSQLRGERRTVEHFAWGSKFLLRGEPVVVSDLNRLPPAAAEYVAKKKQMKLGAPLYIPLIMGENVIGFIGLSAATETRHWSQDEIDLMRMAGEIFASTLARHQAQQDLERLAQRQALILDAAGDGIVGCDAHGQLTFINPAARAMLGFGAEDLIGRDLRSVTGHVHQSDAEEECDILQALRDGQVHQAEGEPFQRADGKKFQVEYVSTPLHEAGVISGVVLVFRDITLREQARQALEESQNKYASLFAHNHSVSFLIDPPSGAIVDVNEAACEMYGYTRDQFLQLTVSDINILTPAEIQIEMERAVRAERNVFHFRHRLASGEVRDVDVYSGPVNINGRELLLSIVHDVTARRMAERQVEINAARASALARIAARLNARLEVEAVLEAVCTESAQALNASAAVVFLADRAHGMLKPAHQCGAQAFELLDLPLIPIAIYEALARKEENMILLQDQAGGQSLLGAELGARLDIQTLAAASLWRDDKLIGMLGIMESGKQREFTTGELEVLRGLADQAAQAIDNASLYQQAYRRIRFMQALRNIDLVISSSVDIRLVLQSILEQVRAQLAVDAAEVLLLDESTYQMEFAAGSGFRTSAFRHTRLSLGDGLAGRAAMQRETVSVADLRRVLNAPHFGYTEAEWERARFPELKQGVDQEGFRAYYGVPLIAKGEVKGVLEIFHRQELAADQEWLEFLEALAGQAAIAIDNAKMYHNLQRSHNELVLAYDVTLESLSRVLELRDKETEEHTSRTTEMTLRLAQAMGVPSSELVHIRRGATLHDIGKMGVPDQILNKPGPLDESEWAIMRQHPEVAYHTLLPVEFLRPALDIPYCHHERWDGSGYPRELAGLEIPLAARIFAVVDVWDALRSNRSYRPAWPQEKVEQYLREQAGKQFDPEVVTQFLQLIREIEI